ncbi:MAG: efflux RND transporter periplasmic adaptor subunit [Acidobacteria bacterium]|nr:efflux RND transporter periplasmic adaptor subunit [Acidobacteriota bacterium]
MFRHSCRVASVVALPLLLAACSSSGSRADGSSAGSQSGRAGGRGAAGPVPVVTARVEQRAVPVTLQVVGTVEAMSSVQIRSQVTGQLSAVHFAEGQEVAIGQPLFSLDSRPFLATVQQAEAVLARDTATLQNARAQQARTETLFKRGLIPRDQNDTQLAGVESSAATVAADKAALEGARLNLQYTDIKSPINGRTGTLGAHVGDLIRANDTTALVVINQLSPVYVTFAVPGRYLTDIRRYQAQKPLPVTTAGPAPSDPIAPAEGDASATPPGTSGSTGEASSPGAPTVSARGVLSFIDNMVDSTTGTIRLKGTFPNSDRQLWPGAFVQVTLQLTTEANALLVPATAVQMSQDGQFIYVVKPDRTVEMRPVRVDRQQGDAVVVAEGLSAGEVVVTDGQLRLTPGASVSERTDANAGRGPGGRPGGTQTTGNGGRQGSR